MDMTVVETAKALGISERAVRSRIEVGTLCARRAGPRVLLISEQEVRRALLDGVPLGPRRKSNSSK